MFNLGVDLGGTTIKVGLVAENGTIAARAACSTCPERGAAAPSPSLAPEPEC